jgi:hypothetical protein
MLRRQFVFGAATFSLLVSGGRSFAKGIAAIKEMRIGEFIWRPELSPKGPVVVVVSIPQQLVHVYRNGLAIAVSTCSTGAPGHSTPTGVFTILQKREEHYSSTYNNAPMPNMQRLTWRGIALHAGHLPGYPASKGCIRLPLEFSRLLFSVTGLGTSSLQTRQAPTVPLYNRGSCCRTTQQQMQKRPKTKSLGRKRVLLINQFREMTLLPFWYQEPIARPIS